MTYEARPLVLALCSLIALPAGGLGQDVTPESGPACGRDLDDYFVREVWGNVWANQCLQCHTIGGDAEESGLILHDPTKNLMKVHVLETAAAHHLTTKLDGLELPIEESSSGWVWTYQQPLIIP